MKSTTETSERLADSLHTSRTNFVYKYLVAGCTQPHSNRSRVVGGGRGEEPANQYDGIPDKSSSLINIRHDHLLSTLRTPDFHCPGEIRREEATGRLKAAKCQH